MKDLVPMANDGINITFPAGTDVNLILYIHTVGW